jgi:hypothetical protein
MRGRRSSYFDLKPRAGAGDRWWWAGEDGLDPLGWKGSRLPAFSPA